MPSIVKKALEKLLEDEIMVSVVEVQDSEGTVEGKTVEDKLERERDIDIQLVGYDKRYALRCGSRIGLGLRVEAHGQGEEEADTVVVYLVALDRCSQLRMPDVEDTEADIEPIVALVPVGLVAVVVEEVLALGVAQFLLA